MHRKDRIARFRALPAAMLVATVLGCGGTDITPPVDAGVGVDAADRVPSTETGKPVVGTNMLDLIFLIDDSAGMWRHQEKLAAQFPKLLTALEDPGLANPLPDLRIAFLSSDLGSGASGTCTPSLGDRGQFQMREPPNLPCGQNAGARWLETNPPNFAGGDLAKVAGCLIQGMGSSGCGFEQPLQSLRFAFTVDQTDPTGQSTGVAVKDFLRDNATLAIVLLTDEDDCSTPLNSLLAQTNPMITESWSLRCATRGHQCAGQNLDYPTQQRFVTDYANCAARTDYCPADETAQNPTACSPLASVAEIAEAIKDYKRKQGGSQDQILVAGIFGKPIEGQTIATYRIDKVPSPVEGQPEIYDYWPICYDPTHPGPLDGTAPYDRQAAGWGAYGGLRIQAFLDQFPKENALAFSICETDYGPAMSKIGAVVAIKRRGR